MTTEQSPLIDERLSALETRIEALEKILQSSPQQALGNTKQLSPKEFLLKYAPKDDVSKTLLLAYFLEFMRGIGSFTVADIESAFREAREPVPENLNDKVYKNVKKGTLMDQPNQKGKEKAWTLTATGQRWCEENAEGKK